MLQFFQKISRTDQKNLACFNSKKTIKEGKSVDILPSFFIVSYVNYFMCKINGNEKEE